MWNDGKEDFVCKAVWEWWLSLFSLIIYVVIFDKFDKFSDLFIDLLCSVLLVCFFILIISVPVSF